MIRLRVYSPAARTGAVIAALQEEPALATLAVHRGDSLRPPGDVVVADIPRECANAVIERLRTTGVTEDGAIQLEPIPTWISRPGYAAERLAPGAESDAVVWSDVVQRAYEESTLTFAFATFMVFATLIASIGIVLDSQILIIGAMVLGPEFGAVAALGISLVRRRAGLLRQGLTTLAAGFGLAISAACLAVLAGRGLGWVHAADIEGRRPGTDFIYQPDRWSILVAIIAGAAGVLSMTSARSGGLTGVFISVTTIPAAANIAAGAAFGLWSEVGGSAAQLLVNISGMAAAGWLTLVVQQAAWSRVASRRLQPPT